jgi:hypothetical protein
MLSRLPMAILNKFVRRYTSVSAVIDMLRRKEIALLDPQNWDDRNDRYFMNLYKEERNIKGLYGLCASMASETYHHWRVFTGPADGACVELKRGPLEKALSSKKELRFGEVEYLLFKDLEKLTGKDFDRLPFVKRHGFKDEAEYRIIAQSDDRQRAAYPIKIKLSWINRITINPWLPDTISKSVIAALKQLPDCANLAIYKSRLIDSSRWKKGGDDVVGRMSAKRRKTKP